MAQTREHPAVMVKDGDFAAALEAQARRNTVRGNPVRGKTLAGPPEIPAARAPARVPVIAAARLGRPAPAVDPAGLMERYGLSATPHPGASRRYPVSTRRITQTHAVPRSLGHNLALSAGTLAVAAVSGLAVVHLLQPSASVSAAVMLCAAFVAAAVLFVKSRQTVESTVEGYPEDSLAELPGWVDGSDERLTLAECDEADDPIEAEEVLDRRDGVALPPGGLTASARRDLLVHVGEAGVAPRAADSSAAAADERHAEGRHAEEALLLFAEALERELGLAAGSVWVTYPMVCVAQGGAGQVSVAGVEFASLLIRGGRAMDVERVCDGVVRARDRVRDVYQTFPLAPRVETSVRPPAASSTETSHV